MYQLTEGALDVSLLSFKSLVMTKFIFFLFFSSYKYVPMIIYLCFQKIMKGEEVDEPVFQILVRF